MKRIIILLTSSSNDREAFVSVAGGDYPFIIIDTADSVLTVLEQREMFPPSNDVSQIIIVKLRPQQGENVGNVNAVLNHYEYEAVVGVHLTDGTVDERISPKELKGNCKSVTQYSTQNKEIEEILESILNLVKTARKEGLKRTCINEFERLWNILNPWTPWRYEYFLEVTLRMIALSEEDVQIVQKLIIDVDGDGQTQYERDCVLSDGEKSSFRLTRETVSGLLENHSNLEWRGSEDHIRIYEEIYSSLYELAQEQRTHLSDRLSMSI